MLLTKKEMPNNFRSRTINSSVSIGPLTLKFITVIVIAALCILYLAQSTQGATQNYKVREMEQKQAELEKENERLDVEAVRLQALKNVDSDKDKKTEDKQFTTVDSLEYVE